MKNYIFLITMFTGLIGCPLDAMSVKKVKAKLYKKLSQNQPLKLEKDRKPTEGYFDAGHAHAEAGYKLPIQTDEQKHRAFSCHFSQALSSFLQAHLQGHPEAMKYFKEVEAYIGDNGLQEASRRHMLEKEKISKEQKARRQRSSSLRATYQRQRGPETFEAGMAKGQEAIVLAGKHLSLWPITAANEVPAQDFYSQLQERFKDLREAEAKAIEAISLFIKSYDDEGYLSSLTEAKRLKKFLDGIQTHKANYPLLFWPCQGLTEANNAIEERWKNRGTNSPSLARLTVSDPCANCLASETP